MTNQQKVQKGIQDFQRTSDPYENDKENKQICIIYKKDHFYRCQNGQTNTFNKDN